MAFLFFFVAGRPSIERSLLINSSAHAQSVPRPLRMRRDATWELLLLLLIPAPAPPTAGKGRARSLQIQYGGRGGV